MHQHVTGLFYDLDRATLYQNFVVLFDEDYQVAVVGFEEFSYRLWERQLIFSRYSGFTYDLHGITPSRKHGIRAHRWSVTKAELTE